MTDADPAPPVDPDPDEPPVDLDAPPVDPDEPAELDDEAADAPPDEPEARMPSAAELKRFEAECTRHEKALEKIVGDEWQHFMACEACGGVGFAPKPAELQLDLVKAPGVIECTSCEGAGGRPCVTCDGKGGLEYPTRVEGQRVQSCPSCGGTAMNVCVDCAGNGWRREAAAPAEQPAYATPTVPNGGQQAPTGYILVKIDPNAPDLPAAPPAQSPVAAPVPS